MSQQTSSPNKPPRPTPHRSPDSCADPLMQALSEDRVSRNMSQLDMSAFTSHPQRSIQNWELGERSPNLRKFREMAETMGFRLALVDRNGKLIFGPEDLTS